MNCRLPIADCRWTAARPLAARFLCFPQSPIGNRQSPIPRAFSLLEVLVALMIFAVAAVVLGSTYVNILNSYEAVARGNTRDEDVAFARSLLLAEPDRAKVEAGGEFDSLENRHVRWSATLASTTLPDLFTVTFVCEVADTAKAGDPQKTTQVFTVLRPTWSDATEKTQLRQAVRDRIAEIQGKTKK